MNSSISIDSLGIGVPVEHPRRKGPALAEVIHVQVHATGFLVWDDGCQLCSDSYTFQAPNDPRFGHGISDMPHLDQVHRALTEHYVANRTNLIGAHLQRSVQALEGVIAARDGSSVYFAQVNDRVKIGWSKKVSARLAQLQTGSAHPIQLLGTVPGGRALERRLHDRFAPLRISGEWFQAGPDLLAYVTREAK